MKRLPAFGLAAAFAAVPVAAHANDTMAELAAGGLTFVYADNVQMQSEDLFISPKEVRVDYVFHNDGDKDRTTVVAFPMPDIEGSGDFIVSVPNPESDNFMNFSVTIDGKPVALSPDGSFRYHFVFPDGSYEIPITATSPDGVETRSAILKFERDTVRSGDVGSTSQPPLPAPLGPKS